MGMKIIFLDIDGVLALAFGSMNRNNKWDAYPFDRKAVKVLNKILKETGAEIVLSSDWKHHYGMKALSEIFLELNGVIKAPIDVTPALPTNSMDLEGGRVAEIKLWLKENAEKMGVTHWVSVDDLNMSEGLTNFVHCKRFNEGIKQTGLADKIVKFLS
mgnify:FL=1